MTEERPPKRPRTIAGGAYHDAVPFLPDFDYTVVHASEGALRRFGNDLRPTRLERDVHSAAGSWEATTSWSPPDDPLYALDPSTDMYDTVLDGEVMDDFPVPEQEAAPKKKTNVSRRPHVVWMNLHRQAYLEEVARWAEERTFVPQRIAPTASPVAARSPVVLNIGKWSGSEFHKTSLKTIGLTVQLNHSSMFCESPVPCHAICSFSIQMVYIPLRFNTADASAPFPTTFNYFADTSIPPRRYP
ncbi:hypothetical protein BJ912DRAFT_1070633 [Pholiota molesta]|nr:hypothetical protein BJ912DRAFT_1070633 [Pholiota molesta]